MYVVLLLTTIGIMMSRSRSVKISSVISNMYCMGVSSILVLCMSLLLLCSCH